MICRYVFNVHLPPLSWSQSSTLAKGGHFEVWFQIPLLSLSSCMTLVKLLNLSVLPSAAEKMVITVGHISSGCILGVLNEVNYVIAPCPEHGSPRSVLAATVDG